MPLQPPKPKTIIANWKMYLGVKESIILARQTSKIKTINEIVLCPSFVVLPLVKKELGKKIKLGAQNVAFRDGGALTGEVSAGMLNELGCKYVIIGHSERRSFLNESDVMIREKLKLAVAQKIIPIFCVGETAEARKIGETVKVIKNQLAVLNNLSFDKLVIAYEPVWAIGTGRVPTLEEISDVHGFIRTEAGKSSKNLQIIYGGSVDENNIKKILIIPGVDGVLVGGASTKINFWKKLNP